MMEALDVNAGQAMMTRSLEVSWRCVDQKMGEKKIDRQEPV